MKKLLLNLCGLTALLTTTNFFAQTPGTLTCVFTPTVPSGTTYYTSSTTAIKRLEAVWIETGAGAFVKTKLVTHGCGELNHLIATSTAGSSNISPWQAKSAGNMTGADATTGATKTTNAPTSFTWNATAVSGTVVADGAYNIKIYEVFNHGVAPTGAYTSTLSFTKGATAFTLTPTATSWLKNVTIIWHPANTTDISEAMSVTPIANIYPNPSNGVFTVDFKNATAIKVLNTLGSVIYETKVDGLNEGSKTIDLSAFANGLYFVNVSNGTTSSNQRITLDK